ncbi:GntR family transcriptional regulator [Pigmentiphaga soli]|uniref:GntR family transcriptional regulator n=1 Tax=Pigmentiphaga soli TaxID=1007095 RepID=A0ABP8HCH1_9BURK
MAGKTLSQSIVQSLASDIIAGQLQPGSRLDEQSLADRFKVSRSPVRDALRHLAATRLVEYFPRRGFSVARVDHDQLRDMYEGLTEIEAICAGLCALRADPMERTLIQSLYRQCLAAAESDDPEAYAAANDEFHRAIYAGAHNDTLESVATEMRQRLAPFRSRQFFKRSRIESSMEEHRRLVDALLAQDSQAAAAAMRSHAVHTAVNVLNLISG